MYIYIYIYIICMYVYTRILCPLFRETILFPDLYIYIHIVAHYYKTVVMESGSIHSIQEKLFVATIKSSIISGLVFIADNYQIILYL